MAQQTAVEWLIKQISAILGPLKTEAMTDLLLVDAIQKAKQMEKEQIISAHKEGNKYNGWALRHEHEKYYNETYKP